MSCSPSCSLPWRSCRPRSPRYLSKAFTIPTNLTRNALLVLARTRRPHSRCPPTVCGAHRRSSEVALHSYTLLSSQTCSTSSWSNGCLPAWPPSAMCSSQSRSANLWSLTPSDIQVGSEPPVRPATEVKLAELLARDLSQIDVAVVMIDGVIFCGRCCVVALIITTDARRSLSAYEGDTENTVVVTGLLSDLWAGTALRRRDPLRDRRVQALASACERSSVTEPSCSGVFCISAQCGRTPRRRTRCSGRPQARLCVR